MANCKAIRKSIPTSKERRRWMLETGALADCKFIVGGGLQLRANSTSDTDSTIDLFEYVTYDDDEGLCQEVPTCVKVFECHKMILASASEVFERMFYGNFLEGSEITRITDVDPISFDLFLKYVYCYDLDPRLVTTENIREIVYLSDKYMVTDFADECITILKDKNWHISDIFPIFEIGCMYDNLPLLFASYKKICRNAKDLLEHESFFDIDILNLKRVFVLLTQEDKIAPITLLKALELYGERRVGHSKSPDAANKFSILLDAALTINFRTHNDQTYASQSYILNPQNYGV